MGIDVYVFAKREGLIAEYGGSEHKYHNDEEMQIDLDYPERITKIFGNFNNKNSDRVVKKTEYYQIYSWHRESAIHEWIVVNLLDGKDEFDEIRLTYWNLYDLEMACHEVLKKHSLAKKILPLPDSCESKKYDREYFEELERVEDFLCKVREDLLINEYYGWRCDWKIVYKSKW